MNNNMGNEVNFNCNNKLHLFFINLQEDLLNNNLHDQHNKVGNHYSPSGM